jgi:hypothetical protein
VPPEGTQERLGVPHAPVLRVGLFVSAILPSIVATKKKRRERQVRATRTYYLVVVPCELTCFQSEPILTQTSVAMTDRARCCPFTIASYVSLYVATAVLP